MFISNEPTTSPFLFINRLNWLHFIYIALRFIPIEISMLKLFEFFAKFVTFTIVDVVELASLRSEVFVQWPVLIIRSIRRLHFVIKFALIKTVKFAQHSSSKFFAACLGFKNLRLCDKNQHLALKVSYLFLPLY
jgi:hypothetical protein